MATITRPKLPAGICAYCGDYEGQGTVEAPHPMYGASNCPEPTITVPCPKCRPAENRAARDGGRF